MHIIIQKSSTFPVGTNYPFRLENQTKNEWKNWELPHIELTDMYEGSYGQCLKCVEGIGCILRIRFFCSFVLCFFSFRQNNFHCYCRSSAKGRCLVIQRYFCAVEDDTEKAYLSKYC